MKNQVYIIDSLKQDEVDFLSLYFRDIMCVRFEFDKACFMPVEYKDLETVSIPSVNVLKSYNDCVKTHKEHNRINKIFMDAFWSHSPPWEFSIDKEDVDKINLVESLKEKGYNVDVIFEDEMGYDLKVDI